VGKVELYEGKVQKKSCGCDDSVREHQNAPPVIRIQFDAADYYVHGMLGGAGKSQLPNIPVPAKVYKT
jgi:hypothetical protein